jgi:hypothetical protein
MWEQMMKFSLPAGLGAVCLGVVQIRRMYKREESEGAVTAGFDQAAAPVMETRGACDDAFDAWMHCVIHGACFTGKGDNAGHPELKECARVETECDQLRECVKLCRRAQVDNRKRFKGPQGDRR